MSPERDERLGSDPVRGAAGGEPGGSESLGIDTGRPGDLGAQLRNARTARGLELADVAELTHVRKEYLRALEEGRYGDLPEDVYTRNFVKLFAQAVGLDPERTLSAYQSERRHAGGLTTLEMRLEKERRGEPPPRQRRKRTRSGGGLPRVGPALPTLLLVVALVALAVWGFNRLLARGDGGAARQPTQQTQGAAPPVPLPEGSEAEGAGAAAADAQPQTVLVTINSTPPGATVSIDSFQLPGVTPIADAPVTARAGRVLTVSLDGYQTLEEQVDLLESQTLDVTLAPEAAAAAEDGEPVAATAAGELRIEVTASTWIEVYRGTARNEGDRLLYRTAAPGEVFTYDLPVYVHVGNAAGVELTRGDTVIGTLGSSGAVVGRAFTP